jgi:hypothetical protein
VDAGFALRISRSHLPRLRARFAIVLLRLNTGFLPEKDIGLHQRLAWLLVAALHKITGNPRASLNSLSGWGRQEMAAMKLTGSEWIGLRLP